MANENFKKALYDALVPEYVAVMRDADDTPHKFTQKFERKMQKLVKRRNKPYYNMINTLGKRVACVIALILVASSVTVMSVEALRTAVADFFISIYEKFSTVHSIEDDTAPLTITDLYGITYDLSDYDIVYEEKDIYSYNITYVKNEVIIEFSQYTKDMYDKNVNTEGASISTIDINDKEAIIFLDNHSYHHIIINADDYVFSFGSNIGKDALIDIAKSVQKVESNKN